MCLVIVALAAHSRYATVIAANRDEFHARASCPAQWGNVHPFADVLAGRDLEAGGTWLGVRRDGRWALLTNVRGGRGSNKPNAPSRGDLVPAVLNQPAPPAAALATVMHNASAYNGFNLLAGDAHGATWMSNRSDESRAITTGVHGLSNALLDTPWPKLARTRAAVAAWAAQDSDDPASLFDLLADRACVPDAALPSTGVSLEWERLLSAPFIVSEAYGTRCSTVLAIEHSGNARWVERSYDKRGNTIGEVDVTWEVSRTLY
ncbi:MAG: NRDE family protein [Betaproteobacteria bacterium]